MDIVKCFQCGDKMEVTKADQKGWYIRNQYLKELRGFYGTCRDCLEVQRQADAEYEMVKHASRN